MKKFLALVLVAMMLLPCIGAMAQEVPEGYPEIIEGLDFGGATIWIYDWWSSDDENHSARTAEPDEETAALYAYRDWLEKTYNCKIVEAALSDWAGNPTELQNMVMNGDNSKLCIIAVACDFAHGPLTNDLYMPWQIDLSAEKWNKADIDFMTRNGKVYGVHAGKTEPRSCIYFNKRVLSDANIDPESIYDAQANGTWTWDMMLDIMQKVQRDLDNDGINDIYGMVGSGDELAIGLMFSNNASFFDYNEQGKLAITADSQAALDALQMRKTMGENYMAPQPEGSNWDWFKDYWKKGTVAFYPGQTWQGFNDNAEMADMEDEWGAVMFPKGPNADTYLSMACDNIYGVPNVYDDETALKIQQIYDLYTNDTPGVDSEDSWIGNKYLYTDERAVDETYAMMRENEHSVANKTYLLGSTNDVLGSALLWGPIGSMTPAEAVESARNVWQGKLDVFNGDKTQEEVDAELAAIAEAEAAAAAAAAEEAAEAVEEAVEAAP
ncbi:MAG: hypothetical protein IJJ80_10770 [Clostridia bacterium]|nr:hypothetical protein [Clostridia bacterium]